MTNLPPVQELSEAERKSMAFELCLHRGENPNSVSRGGEEKWETYLPLAGAAIRYAEKLISARPALTELQHRRAQKDQHGTAQSLAADLWRIAQAVGYGDGEVYNTDTIIDRIQHSRAAEAVDRAAVIAECIAEIEAFCNFGDYKREELTADHGQPRFDLMHAIVGQLRLLSASPASPSPATGVRVNQWGEPGVDLDIACYERVHNVAIAAYERHVPGDYRYSATALRHAVDDAIRAALGEQP